MLFIIIIFIKQLFSQNISHHIDYVAFYELWRVNTC